MRVLKKEEEVLIKKRQKEFTRFYSELMPVLKDFLERLGIKNPAIVVNEAENFIDPIETFMKDQEILEKDRVWIQTRIGYFIGEVFVQKYGGCWYLNDIPDSRYFGRYVVGKFAQFDIKSIMIDPFEIAYEYVNEKQGRSLKKYLNDVSIEIENIALRIST